MSFAVTRRPGMMLVAATRTCRSGLATCIRRRSCSVSTSTKFPRPAMVHSHHVTGARERESVRVDRKSQGGLLCLVAQQSRTRKGHGIPPYSTYIVGIRQDQPHSAQTDPAHKLCVRSMARLAVAGSSQRAAIHEPKHPKLPTLRQYLPSKECRWS